jgi:hypothetical protein
MKIINKSRLLKFLFVDFIFKKYGKQKFTSTNKFSQKGTQFYSLLIGLLNKCSNSSNEYVSFLIAIYSLILRAKKIYRLNVLFLIPMLLLSCGSYTIEQQVERIIESDDFEKRQSISYLLADSLSIRPCELLIGLHSNQRAVEALENMMIRYSETLTNQPNDRYQVLACIQYITEPRSEFVGEINQIQIALIIHALQIENLNMEYEEALIKSANLHGNVALEKIIETWYNDKKYATKEKSNSIFKAIKSFDKNAISLLTKRIQYDTIAVDLLARFGKSAVESMQKQMKSESQSIRFAAGEVLVQMQKYEPEAIKILRSAIDLGGTKVIADNYPFYIRLGQDGTENLLSNSLDLYFNKSMCLDYLNCGNEVLESNASRIAAKHGYLVMPSFGSHSGPKWGVGN